MTQSKFLVYRYLMRIDKPVGSLLLLWPTLWGLWISGKGIPPLSILLVFILGVFTMRSAGCIVNDYVDRKLDGYVKRTAKRPIPNGLVSKKEALMLFTILIIISFGLVLTLNIMTIFLSLIALVLACIYPFMKRITYLPQFILGATFGWGIPMSYAAVSQSLPISCWLLFLANICWTVVYDTLYAMVDRNDDLKIGIKSTAILFGSYDRQIIGVLQISTVLLLLWIGYLVKLGEVFFFALSLVSGMFIYQQKQIATRKNEAYFKAFLQNNYVGLIIFISLVFNYLPNYSQSQ